ncbi:MAG: N-acetyltransferase family protein [Nocardioides sp.]
MSRTPVTLRIAVAEDAPFLGELWGDLVRRGEFGDRMADLEQVICSTDGSDQRLLIAEYDGSPAGAVLLRRTTLSPINLEPVVLSFAPTVLEDFRRRGIGRALMEAAVAFAEEVGVSTLATAAISGSRDGNRFMARIGFTSQAVVRVASTHLVRAKLNAQMPISQRTSVGQRSLGQVLAARRSMRRSQALR